MRNPIDRIMNTKYKFIFIGSIIALVVFVIGAATIYELDAVLREKQITYEEVTVLDKYVNEDGNHFYIIISDKNETFDIRNDDDGAELFNKLEVGKHYRFVIQKDDAAQTTHIIQVYNEKS